MISGFLCGNLGVVKSFLTEITDDSNRGKGFSYISIAWSAGCALAPLAGGLLSKPADAFPQTFSKHGVFGEYPYLLPCLLCAIFNVSSSVFCFFFMVESRPMRSSSSEEIKSSGSIELTPTTHNGAKFSIIGDDDEDDDEEIELTLQSDNTSNNATPTSHRLSILQRIASGSKTSSNVDKGKYAKVSVSDDTMDTSDMTDTDTIDSNSNDEYHRNHLNKELGLKVDELSQQPSVNNTLKKSVKSEKSRCICSFCCFGSNTKSVRDLENGNEDLKPSNVLCEREVLLTTSNYGMLAMAYILLNETTPLFLKLNISEGGFSMDSAAIGWLLSLSGATMLLFTTCFLPILSKNSPIWLFQVGALMAIPFTYCWPLAAILNDSVIVHFSDSHSQLFIKIAVLVLVSVGQNIAGCLAFTASMIQVNHSVLEDDLGKVNGFGQSLASLSRAVGPAIGGALWSISMHYHFVFLNFIATSAVLVACVIINRQLPESIAFKKKRPETFLST
mmetsp:Transcript_22034/g.30258  ORF Transcript_22034/g.30258 Transcript_22034/m.30258 type:complete len:502 (+) Transcript_22034:3-1508(+)